MNEASQNTYPLPDSWLENYSRITKLLNLTRFSYPGNPWKYATHPMAFANWIRWQLETTTKQCKGLDKTNCKKCMRSGYPEDAAMAMLAKVVAGIDPQLSRILKERARQLGYEPKQPDPKGPPPQGDPPRRSTNAMPIPKSPINPNAVSQKVSRKAR